MTLYEEMMGIPPGTGIQQCRFELFDSALNRPRQAAYYDNADIVAQAATLIWGLAKNHAFLDGNKRIAWLLMREFLLLNEKDVLATEDERFNFVIAVCEGWSLDETERWLIDHVR